jgi:hypothetical protein
MVLIKEPAKTGGFIQPIIYFFPKAAKHGYILPITASFDFLRTVVMNLKNHLDNHQGSRSVTVFKDHPVLVTK